MKDLRLSDLRFTICSKNPYFVIVLLLFICCQTVFSQMPGTHFEQQYKKAVASYIASDYASASKTFLTLTNSDATNDLSPYSHYYYALSALRLNQLAEGQAMLQKLRSAFPTWNKMDDVNYLSTDFSFRQKQYTQAIAYIQAINSTAVRQEAQQLQKYHLGQIKDSAILKSLSQQYPYDPVLTQAANNVPKNVVHTTNTFKKGYYNVAVMLPFKVEEFEASQRERTNQFAFDLYEGMKMAQTKLFQEGIKVNFTTFDIGNDLKATTDAINSASFQQSDFVVGPVYNEPSKLVADYAETNKVYMIQPTAITNELLQGRASSFLSHATLESQANAAFDFMTFQNAKFPKKIAIYYNPTRRDSLLALAYRNKATASGFQVLDYRKLREKIDSTSTINDRNHPSHVFVSSGNDNDGNKVLAMLTKKKINVPMLSTASAFDLVKVPLGTLNDREIFLLNNDFVDINKQQTKDFQKQYLASRGTIPSAFVMQGYDLMLFYGRMIHKYKNNLRFGLDLQTYKDDYLLQGFDYRKSNDNKATTIFRLEGGRFTVIKQ